MAVVDLVVVLPSVLSLAVAVNVLPSVAKFVRVCVRANFAIFWSSGTDSLFCGLFWSAHS